MFMLFQHHYGLPGASCAAGILVIHIVIKAQVETLQYLELLRYTLNNYVCQHKALIQRNLVLQSCDTHRYNMLHAVVYPCVQRCRAYHS